MCNTTNVKQNMQSAKNTETKMLTHTQNEFKTVKHKTKTKTNKPCAPKGLFVAATTCVSKKTRNDNKTKKNRILSPVPNQIQVFF